MTASAHPPEVPGKTHAAEECLGLCRASSFPFWLVPTGKPALRKLPLSLDRHRLTSWIAIRREPALEVISRPEEKHV